jgi:hypothetical protein
MKQPCYTTISKIDELVWKSADVSKVIGALD